MERTIAGKREVPDKVIVSKVDLQKVEKTINHARQAQWISETELQDERQENKHLKKALSDERKQSDYWRNAWNELNERVEKSLKPLTRSLEKFKDWSFEAFERLGYKREEITETFEGEMEEKQQRKIEQRRRNDFDMER